MRFGKEYYTSGNYRDYLQRGDRYLKLVKEVHDLLSMTCLADKEAPVLDYGCAVGHVVDGLRDLNYHPITGYDISEWAVAQGEMAGCFGLTTDPKCLDSWYYLTFALDVLEHMHVDDIAKLLRKLDTQLMVVRVPVADNNGQFILESAKRDPTHITALNKVEWMGLFLDAGYELLFKLNLSTIWDSDGVMAVVLKK